MVTQLFPVSLLVLPNEYTCLIACTPSLLMMILIQAEVLLPLNSVHSVESACICFCLFIKGVGGKHLLGWHYWPDSKGSEPPEEAISSGV